MPRPVDARWQAPYVHWTTLAAVLWLVLAAVGVPWLATTALLPCFLLPAFLSARGPLAGNPSLVARRMACMVVPTVFVHARNPDYCPYTWTVCQVPPPPLTHPPTTAQVWAQVAAWELAGETLRIATAQATFSAHPTTFARQVAVHPADS